MPRRAPKLPFARAGRSPQAKISDADWTRIERRYGKQLPGRLRSKIQEITSKFLYWAEFELAAPEISQAEDRIRAIKAAAVALRKAILERPRSVTGIADFFAKQFISEHAPLPSEDGSGGRTTSARKSQQAPGIGTFKAKQRTSEHVRLRSEDRRDGLTTLARKTLPQLAWACDKAMAELLEQKKDGGSFRLGDAWEQWIRRLTEMLEEQDLPVAARKDSDKQVNKGPSSFVILVSELQQCIPEQFRRSTQSPEALAKSIHIARRNPRDR